MPSAFHARFRRSRAAVLAAGVALASVSVGLVATERVAASAPRTFHAKGVVKSFGAGRAYVNIAHEDIPGYMNAMTMSFEPKSKTQLDGIAEKDKVEFDFSETDDGRRVLATIQKKE